MSWSPSIESVAAAPIVKLALVIVRLPVPVQSTGVAVFSWKERAVSVLPELLLSCRAAPVGTVTAGVPALAVSVPAVQSSSVPIVIAAVPPTVPEPLRLSVPKVDASVALVRFRIPADTVRVSSLSIARIDVVPVVKVTDAPAASIQTWSAAPGTPAGLQFAGVCHELPEPPTQVFVAVPPQIASTPGPPPVAARPTGKETSRTRPTTRTAVRVDSLLARTTQPPRVTNPACADPLAPRGDFQGLSAVGEARDCPSSALAELAVDQVQRPALDVALDAAEVLPDEGEDEALHAEDEDDADTAEERRRGSSTRRSRR